MIDEEKYNHSLEVLRLASQMSEQYYKKPLLITYSGGKDSDVLLQLALESGIKFEVQNSHTTVDAPPTVYHIRETFGRLHERGINASVFHSRYKDGRLITMWNLIEKKKYPPTRMARYCCLCLKETATPNRFIATGVRRAESARRANREEFLTRSKTRDGEWYKGKSLAETEEVYKEAQENDEVYDCLLITQAKKNMDLVCNPILYWTDSDVWNFIKDRNIKVCDLYSMGFKRVGCVGCPMASKRERERVRALPGVQSQLHQGVRKDGQKCLYGRRGYNTGVDRERSLRLVDARPTPLWTDGTGGMARWRRVKFSTPTSPAKRFASIVPTPR